MIAASLSKDRSFVRRSKAAEVTNRSFQGIEHTLNMPSFSRDRSFVKRSKKTQQGRLVKDLCTAKNPSPSDDVPSFVSSNQSSFWSEWAEEVIVNDKENNFEIVVKPRTPVVQKPEEDEILQARQAMMSTSSESEQNSTCVLDGSMDLLAALDITGAEVASDEQDIEAAPNRSVYSVEGLSLAIELSNTAASLIKENKYEKSLDTYKQAVDKYQVLVNDQESVIAAVNAAGCFRNMSTVARNMDNHSDAVKYLRRAEALYVRSREAILAKQNDATVTLDGKLLEDSEVVPDASVSCMEEVICLDSMILETLQSRASFYVEYQNAKELAVQCHEHCLKLLLHLDILKQWQHETANTVRLEGVTYIPLGKDDHEKLLIKSLDTVGSYYMELASVHEISTDLFEDGIDILQTRMEHSEIDDNDTLLLAVSKNLQQLADVYFQLKQMDRAVNALHDSASVKLIASGEPDAQSLEIMDKIGQDTEKAGDLDTALSCFEQTFAARCRFYGNTDLRVAKSLVNVARVTEKMDGFQEAVELYRAANAIYALQVTRGSSDASQDVNTILHIMPAVLKQGQFEKAVTDLNMCLELEDKVDQTLDKAQILFDLGRAHLGMKDFKTASNYLVEAVKEAGHVNDKEAVCLLQDLEFATKTAEKQVEEEKENSVMASETSTAVGPRESVSVVSKKSSGNDDVIENSVSFHEWSLCLLNGDLSAHILEDNSENTPIKTTKLAPNGTRSADGENTKIVTEQELQTDKDPGHAVTEKPFIRDASAGQKDSFLKALLDVVWIGKKKPQAHPTTPRPVVTRDPEAAEVEDNYLSVLLELFCCPFFKNKSQTQANEAPQPDKQTLTTRVSNILKQVRKKARSIRNKVPRMRKNRVKKTSSDQNSENLLSEHSISSSGGADWSALYSPSMFDGPCGTISSERVSMLDLLNSSVSRENALYHPSFKVPPTVIEEDLSSNQSSVY